MTSKPRPGERYSDYLARYARELLLRAGASETESSDFCEVLVIRTNVLKASITDAGTQLMDWRAEKRALARDIRTERRRRVDAGYLSADIDAPVFLNGDTAW